MNPILKRLATGIVAACLLTSSALAARITPSVSQVRLKDQETSISFDITLQADETFAGAEFGIKPSRSDVKFDSLTYLNDIENEATVDTEKDGVLYFGFFSGFNKYQPGTYRVARLTYTYSGDAPRTIDLDSSRIITVDEDAGTTRSDGSSAPFSIQITRVPAGGGEGGSGGNGGGGNSGGGNGGGTIVIPPADPTKPVKPVRPQTGFVDVRPGDYFHDAVDWAVANKITNGLTATTFAPHASCTRAQTVTFLWRAAGCPEPAAADLHFTDVPANAYYAKAVRWAVQQGITQGVTATTFCPDATVTRGQTVTFLWRFAGSPAAGTAAFADVPANAYYAGAVAWADRMNITHGVTAAQFQPGANCTRGQIVTFLYRFYQN